MKTLWDETFGHLPGFQCGDDSPAVCNLFFGTGTHKEWDCTGLFKATLLRHNFLVCPKVKTMWDNTFGHLPGFQCWYDCPALWNVFFGTGQSTKVPTNCSYDEWDCTALFKATLLRHTLKSMSVRVPCGCLFISSVYILHVYPLY